SASWLSRPKSDQRRRSPRGSPVRSARWSRSPGVSTMTRLYDRVACASPVAVAGGWLAARPSTDPSAGSRSSGPEGRTQMKGYVAQKGRRWYAVIYDGLDPVNGRERRIWHPAGIDRADAERLAARLAAEVNG